MRVRFTALLLSFVLVIVLFPSVVHGDQLCEGLSENEEVVRSQRSFPLPSFLSFLPSSVRRVLELLTSVPTAVITYIRSVLFYVWDSILSVFLFFSPIAATISSTTTLAPTAMTMTSTPVTSAVVTSSVMTSSIPVASTDATMMMTTNPVTSAASTGASMMSSTSAVVMDTTSATGMTTMSSTAMETTTSAMTTTTGMKTTTMVTTTTGTTTAAGPTLPPTKLVFVTNVMFDGNIGGLEVGDMICESAASVGNLNGYYLPWLSNNTHSPSTRFVQSLVLYVMLDGTRFADSFDSLVTDGPLNALDVTELNQTITSTAVADIGVWMGTNADGTSSSASGSNCLNWKSSQDGGVLGFLSVSDMVSWTIGSSGSCSDSYWVYCFQQ